MNHLKQFLIKAGISQLAVLRAMDAQKKGRSKYPPYAQPRFNRHCADYDCGHYNTPNAETQQRILDAINTINPALTPTLDKLFPGAK